MSAEHMASQPPAPDLEELLRRGQERLRPSDHRDEVDYDRAARWCGRVALLGTGLLVGSMLALYLR